MNFKPSILAFAAMACLSTAHADMTTFTGDTTGGPTFNRLLEDLSDPSLVGTDVAYSTYSFSVSLSGEYTFLTTADFDSFIFLYSPSFNAAAPMTNALAGNDDLLGLTTSGFAQTLTAGTAYTFVTTGFANEDFGSFSTTIGGPGLIVPMAAAVPEPETYALMLLGLGVLTLGRRFVRSKQA